MRTLSLLVTLIIVGAARAEPLRLILVPQQLVVPRQPAPAKFDLFLYNAGRAARTVPSIEQFRAFYSVRYHTNADSKSRTVIRAFSHRIKDHTLKAQGVDHTVVEIDLSPEDGDYIELRVEVGHDERAGAASLSAERHWGGPAGSWHESNHAMERTADRSAPLLR